MRPPTVRKTLVTLQSMLRVAVEGQRIPSNPVKATRKPTVRPERAVTPPAPVTVERIRAWLQEHGDALFRSKGVFNAQGFNQRVVFQSVRMLTTMSRFTDWEPGVVRGTEYVVIGRDLDRDALQAGFATCLAR